MAGQASLASLPSAGCPTYAPAHVGHPFSFAVTTFRALILLRLPPVPAPRCGGRTYGEPALRKMKISFTAGGKTLSEKQVRFGMREISYELSLLDSHGDRGQDNSLGYIYVIERSMDLTLNRRSRLAGERHSNFHIGLAAIVLWQGRYHPHISHTNGPEAVRVTSAALRTAHGGGWHLSRQRKLMWELPGSIALLSSSLKRRGSAVTQFRYIHEKARFRWSGPFHPSFELVRVRSVERGRA